MINQSFLHPFVKKFGSATAFFVAKSRKTNLTRKFECFYGVGDQLFFADQHDILTYSIGINPLWFTREDTDTRKTNSQKRQNLFIF